MVYAAKAAEIDLMSSSEAGWARPLLLAATALIAITCIIDSTIIGQALLSRLLPEALSVPLCAVAMLGCIAAIVRRETQRWLIGPVAFWLLSAAANLPITGQAALAATSWVPVLEGLLIAAVLLRTLVSHQHGDNVRAVAMVLAGAMLILFGAIHLMMPEAIANLLPAGFPMANFLPYASGAIQLTAGLTLVLPRARRGALILTSMMYLSWLPLVHIPRLISTPADASEWRFALTALALAAALAWLSQLSISKQETTNDNS